MRVLEPEEFYDVMHCAYESGVLDKLSAIQGAAVTNALERAGLSADDLLERANEVEDEALQRLDLLIGRMGPALKCLGTRFLMRLVSRALDLGVFRRMLVTRMGDSLLRKLGEEGAAPGGSHMSEIETRKRWTE